MRDEFYGEGVPLDVDGKPFVYFDNRFLSHIWLTQMGESVWGGSVTIAAHDLEMLYKARVTRKVIIGVMKATSTGLKLSHKDEIYRIATDVNTPMLIAIAYQLGCSTEFIERTSLPDFLALFEALGFDEMFTSGNDRGVKNSRKLEVEDVVRLMGIAYMEASFIPYIRAGFTDMKAIYKFVDEGIDPSIAASLYEATEL